MTFKVKMDDNKINVDIEKTNVKDVLKYCKPKEQLVLLKKYGLDGGKQTPLQRIWAEYGLTRERVRQIEGQGLMRFRRIIIWNENYLRVLEEAKKILDMNGGFLQEEDLVSKIINKWLFKFTKQELKLILVSDFDIYYLKRNKKVRDSFYIEPFFEDVINEIASYTLDYFNKQWKSSDLYEFIEQLKEKFWKKYEEISYLQTNVFYINFFKSVIGLSVFDWKIWLDEFTEVNPKTIKQKVVYTLRRINKPLHYNEIATKVIEWFEWKPIKVNTIHNELVKNSDIFVNLGLWIYWLKEWGYEWGTVKDILERVFKKANRPMNIKEITKEVVKEKMISPNTIVLTLQKHRDIFERVEKWTYRLRK